MYDVTVYIENDIKGPARADASYAAIAECIDSKGTPHTVEVYGHRQQTTNNQILLNALCEILPKIKTGCNITVSLDNQWLVNMLTYKSYARWSKNNWKTAKDKDIQNKKDWIKLVCLLDNYNMTYTYKEDHVYKEYMEEEIKRRKATKEWKS